ncbi:MAG TPA: 8-amino-7-oxononanoate synthase [Steroidobacteraceae bacterium]|nr:8-amino-7-oxononanoate synthase [Steroidobacteraceae bacterium]
MRRDATLLRQRLAQLEASANRRRARIVEARVGASVVVAGRELVDFCANDYLGLTRHPALIRAAQAAAATFGAGSGSAHLVTGHTREHQALEEELAAFTGRQRALLFSTGYMANLGVVGSFCARHEQVLEDRLNHASLIDAARLSGAELERYAHLDAAAAERLLAAGRATLLATDGVFSMDGDVAPLAALAAATAAHDSWLLVDDAHGLGVLGPEGAGSVQEAGLGEREVPLLMGTLGKALGSFGAFVAGEHEVIEYLLQTARTFIYTTALPPPAVAASRAALRVLREEPQLRARLHAHIARFTTGAAQLGLQLGPSRTAIQPLRVGGSAAALALSAALEAAGFWVAAIRPPTVPEGSARLRITLSAAHRESQIDALLETLGRLCGTARAAH